MICEVAQADWTQSYPSENTVCSSVSGLAEAGYAITLESGQVDDDNHFGNWTTAVKSGTKFHDLDNDREARESGEEPPDGFTIRIYSDEDESGDLSLGDVSPARPPGRLASTPSRTSSRASTWCAR